MTLAEARDSIGARVAYRRPLLEAEEGVITSAGKYVVFVRYGDDGTPRATNPGDLTLIAGGS